MFAPTVLLWEAFVSFAMLGFGFGLLRLCRLQRLPIAVAACAGIAVWVLLGGWLNLGHLVTRPVLLWLLASGVLLFLWELLQEEMRLRLGGMLRSFRSNRLALTLAIPIVGYFLLLFAAHLRPVSWNANDDQQGYMALAEKSAAFDHMPSDPFCERRTASGLGGSIFLDRTMLAGADDSTMDYLDSGFGYLVYVLAIWSIGKALRLSNPECVVLLYLVPLFPLGKVNLTIIYLSASSFLSMLLLLLHEGSEDRGWEEGLRPRVAVVLGLLLGAAFTLKSTNMPIGFLFVLCVGSALVWYRRRVVDLIWPAAIVVALLALVVLPWMVALRHDQGTYLFPALGRGYHISAYGLVPLPSAASPKLQSLVIASPLMLMVLLAGLFAVWLSRGWGSAIRLPIFAFYAATLAAVPVVAVSTGGTEVDRYTLPFTMPCVLLLAGCTLFARRTASKSLAYKIHFGAAAVMVLGCALTSEYLIGRNYDRNYNAQEIWTITGRTQPGSLDPGTMLANGLAVRRAQEAVPKGAEILELTPTGYGYDWQRNPVFIGDYPGMSGPPPGPPLTGSPEELRLYLLGCGVHYVVYDRAMEWPVDFAEFLQRPGIRLIRGDLKLATERRIFISAWSREEWIVSSRFRNLIGEIAQPQRVIYDDGRIATIRLD
jgi:hypothetical protein